MSRCTHDPRPRHSRLETEPPPFPSQSSFDELNSAVMSTDFSIFRHTFRNCLAIYGLLIHREIKKQNLETVSWHHKPWVSRSNREGWKVCGWILTLLFFASLWTLTLSHSINTQKQNLANIHPSWLIANTWSLTSYFTSLLLIFSFLQIQDLH